MNSGPGPRGMGLTRPSSLIANVGRDGAPGSLKGPGRGPAGVDFCTLWPQTPGRVRARFLR
jgi:hypothetical protein